MGRKRNRRELEAAEADEAPVLLRRTIADADELSGFVVGIGEDWVVIHREAELRLNGWTAVRLDTVSELELARNPAVLDRALEFWGQRVEPPGLDLSAVDELVRSAAVAYPLLAIYEEEIEPQACWIGRPTRVTGKKVDLLEVTPAAEWDPEPRRFVLDRVTRIDVGDEYQTALEHLAGPAPLTVKVKAPAG